MKLLRLTGVLAATALISSPSTAQVARPINEHVVRFDMNEEARRQALPSLSFEDRNDRETDRPVMAMTEWPMTGFTFRAWEEDGKSGHEFILEEKEPLSLYGTGEVSGRLLRNGRTVVCWNTDSYAYGDDTKSLYQSHPWVLAVRQDGTAFGVLADTTYRCTIDLTSGIHFRAEGPPFPVIHIEGETPQEVIIRLTDLVGRITMPPKWAVGYHQCRYSYYPDARVREIADEFRSRDLPCDVIWMDIDYMDGFRCFTFSPEHFPDPSATNAYLHERGFHSVWMIDPGIKNEDGYFVHDEGDEIGAWVLRADGTEYNGDVWPGECVFPDYLNRGVREWWAGLYKDFMASGIDGVWNDMNEPAVFNVPSKTMPEDNIHRADPELGGKGPHARYHNVYGVFMVKASREGIMDANPDKRPFVLSRASFIGGHRYGAMWTGDNVADWYHLESSVPMTLNMGLSGQPFAGPDIGGFAGNGTPEMISRWIGFGALMPFARSHTGKGNIDKEPWAFTPEIEQTSRDALETRYKLLPHFYTLFHEASVNGLPVARPLFFADPKDPALRSEDDSFLLGEGLLVRCFLTPERDRVPVMPKGIWRRAPIGPTDDPDLPELYVKGGAIIPTGPVMQHVSELPLNPLTLWVALDEHGEASGTLYEDAGEGWAYKDGEYLLTEYAARLDGDTVVVEVVGAEGDMRPMDRQLTVNVLLEDRIVTGQGMDGDPLRISLPD